MTTPPPPIAFLSDYGRDDPFVGLCHAAVAAVAPLARVIDLSHAVPPQAVRHGAMLLADSLPWLPPGAVVLAVVDPGVGTARRGVALAAGAGAESRFLVGPDNGLLMPCAQACGGVSAAWSLPPPPSGAHTFDGRDVFAPAAARLALGQAPETLGEPVEPDQLVPLSLPEPRTSPGLLRAEVGHVDRFGNLQLLARTGDLAAAGMAPATPVTVSVAATTVAAGVARAFADVAPGEVAVLPDAFGRVQVAVNRGSAARKLGAGSGDTVAVEARER